MNKAVAFISCIFILCSFLVYNQVEEDTFIYFRLAENIVNGYGYVFNPGGERIESGSSITWLGMLILMYYLPGNILFLTKLLSVIFSILTIVLSYNIGRVLFRNKVLWLLAPALLSFNVPFLMWTQRGLETAMYTFLVVWFVLFLIDRRYHRHWWIPGVLVVISRPEALILLLAIVVFFLLNRDQLKNIVTQGCIVIGAIVLLVLWRFYYFDDFVVHPFYNKIEGNAASAWGGMLRFSQGFRLHWAMLIVLVAMLSRKFWNQRVALLLSLLLILIYWFSYNFEIKPFNRHAVPFLPLTFLLLAYALSVLLESFEEYRVHMSVCVLVLVLMFLGGISEVPLRGKIKVANPLFENTKRLMASPTQYVHSTLSKMRDPAYLTEDDKDRSLGGHNIYYNYQATVGQFIAMNYPLGIKVVYDQMGQTPYYAGDDKEFIDSFGLLSRKVGLYNFSTRAERSASLRVYDGLISRLTDEPRHFSKQQVLDYIYDEKPDVIMIHLLVAASLPGSVTAMVAKDPRLNRDYIMKYILAEMVLVYERMDVQTDMEKITIPLKLGVQRYDGNTDTFSPCCTNSAFVN